MGVPAETVVPEAPQVPQVPGIEQNVVASEWYSSGYNFTSCIEMVFANVVTSTTNKIKK